MANRTRTDRPGGGATNAEDGGRVEPNGTRSRPRVRPGEFELGKESNRECGDCSLCCKLLAVGKTDGSSEFNKPRGEWCPLVGVGCQGCSVHDTPGMPADCIEFKCMWLEGLFPDSYRPDRIGIVVSLEGGNPEDRLTDMHGRLLPNTPGWCLYEDTPGATRRKKGAWLTEELRETCIRSDVEGPIKEYEPPTIVIQPNGRRWIRMQRQDEWQPLYSDDAERERWEGTDSYRRN